MLSITDSSLIKTLLTHQQNLVGNGNKDGKQEYVAVPAVIVIDFFSRQTVKSVSFGCQG